MTLRWEVVQIGVRCAYGCSIAKGELAAFGIRRFVLCKSHARRYQFVPPRNFKKKQAARDQEEANATDPKLRQLGADQ